MGWSDLPGQSTPVWSQIGTKTFYSGGGLPDLGIACECVHDCVHDCVHYLDDFLFLGPPASLACQVALGKAMALCDRLGLPVAPAKTVGPSPALSFLGIEINSMTQKLRLPGDKLSCLRLTLSKWEHRQVTTMHDLQVLIGC